MSRFLALFPGKWDQNPPLRNYVSTCCHFFLLRRKCPALRNNWAMPALAQPLAGERIGHRRNKNRNGTER
jgi:hypothetical protein